MYTLKRGLRLVQGDINLRFIWAILVNSQAEGNYLTLGSSLATFDQFCVHLVDLCFRWSVEQSFGWLVRYLVLPNVKQMCPVPIDTLCVLYAQMTTGQGYSVPISV